ncbi:jg10916 [Pararge aegeria aegeria]|uniref:Jg10916 protein n=1 Tax=Pararge aegeria aegeria TaxID=348720 RepID=A0A8S4SF39_9NEOP|nr:jg10916 [Pararge aegeria aegeria]
MLIKEYRVTLPLTVEEYQVGQLYCVAEVSKNETGGGEGIEVIKNEPFKDYPLLGGGHLGDKLLIQDGCHQTVDTIFLSLVLYFDTIIAGVVNKYVFRHFGAAASG